MSFEKIIKRNDYYFCINYYISAVIIIYDPEPNCDLTIRNNIITANKKVKK